MCIRDSTQAAAQLHLADRVHLPFNLMISNVPAPPQQLSVGLSLIHI